MINISIDPVSGRSGPLNLYGPPVLAGNLLQRDAAPGHKPCLSYWGLVGNKGID